MKKINEITEDNQSGESGKSGQAGSSGIQYRDFVSPRSRSRDQVLPQSEVNRLLMVQQELHKQQLVAQKALRKERADIKSGKQPKATAQYGRGLQGGGGGSSRYKKHPLSDKAQFSGANDPKVNFLPDRFEATDVNKQEELKNELQNQNRLTNQYSRTPRPRPPGA